MCICVCARVSGRHLFNSLIFHIVFMGRFIHLYLACRLCNPDFARNGFYISFVSSEKRKIYHVNLHYPRGNRAPFFRRMIKAFAFHSTTLRAWCSNPYANHIHTHLHIHTQYDECHLEQNVCETYIFVFVHFSFFSFSFLLRIYTLHTSTRMRGVTFSRRPQISQSPFFPLPRARA